MSKGEVLFSKKRQYTSQPEQEDEDGNNLWDDSKIVLAFDRGLELASAGVAKRIAMNTNTKLVDKASRSKVKKTNKSVKKRNNVWAAGKSCRAIYQDGYEYEAIIKRIINNEECVVKYLGYGNSEIVPISSLKESHGVQAKAKQIEEALKDFGEECHSSDDSDNIHDMNEDRDHFVREDSSKSGMTTKKRNFFLPDMPPMPSMSMLKNLVSMDIPMPPPPPMLLNNSGCNDEDRAMSSMLISWYMNGYYTGLYQAMKTSKRSRED